MLYLFATFLIIATILDLKTLRIPNWLNLIFFAFTLLWIDKFWIAILAISLLIQVFFGRYVGAGDIKMGTVVALWSHHLHLSQYWIYAALIAGGLFGLISKRRSIPFAPFIASGVLIANLARNYLFI